MEKFGYIRVSTEEQETARQQKIMDDYGIEAENLYIEKVSGKNLERPKLKALLNYLRKGDALYVESISRLSRSVRDFLQIIDTLQAKQVTLVSSKENFDTNSSQGKFMLTIFAALSELEREQILQRQREGIAEAKKRGVYKGRVPIKIDEKRFKEVCKRWTDGEITAVEAMRKLNLSSNTFYRRVKALGIQKPPGRKTSAHDETP